MSEHRTCRHPDRDCPKLMCGYPLPCPHHTVIIDEDAVHIPLDSDVLKSERALQRVGDVAKAVRK
jgi:hypothetical protein